MKKAKKYIVESSDNRSGRENRRREPMTLPELINYFGYTLEVGNSWNKKIQRQPKTINAFIKHYNLAVDERYGGYHRPYLTLVKTQLVAVGTSIQVA